MVNASLNISSIVGFILILWGLAAGPASIAQIIFLIKRSNSFTAITKPIYIALLAIGRFLGSISAGLIIFFQGWRLDPFLQFAVVLLAVGVILESSIAIIEDIKRRI